MVLRLIKEYDIINELKIFLDKHKTSNIWELSSKMYQNMYQTVANIGHPTFLGEKSR